MNIIKLNKIQDIIHLKIQDLDKNNIDKKNIQSILDWVSFSREVKDIQIAHIKAKQDLLFKYVKKNDDGSFVPWNEFVNINENGLFESWKEYIKHEEYMSAAHKDKYHINNYDLYLKELNELDNTEYLLSEFSNKYLDILNIKF